MRRKLLNLLLKLKEIKIMDQKVFGILEKVSGGISVVAAVATLVVKGIQCVPGYTAQKEQNKFDKLFNNRMMRDGKL